MSRVPITADIQELVLTKSARRCAFCFGFEGSLQRKPGQLAHIDRNHGNSTESNLAFLCLEHHDEYDTMRSQSKGVTERELRYHRDRLHEAIARGAHHHAPTPIDTRILEHDRAVFVAADAILSETHLREFLYEVAADHSYTRAGINPIDHFLAHFGLESNAYIHDELPRVAGILTAALNELSAFLALNFFVYPSGQEMHPETGFRFCMYPELNIDRGGRGARDDAVRYGQYALKLEEVVEHAQIAYVDYRRTIKRVLIA
ncbi:hypothetical protein WME76_22740 [Sorangium sp. So ce119]|uniref:hypothetical protein n=1 Tax=Sorangium sp. So ce119 TaxID=3133279 RepID=UPI003F5FE6D3